MDTNTNQSDTDELAGELLVGKDAIQAFLEYLGMPEGTDPYYLRRTGWPIGKTSGGGGRKPHRHQTPPYPPHPKARCTGEDRRGLIWKPLGRRGTAPGAFVMSSTGRREGGGARSRRPPSVTLPDKRRFPMAVLNNGSGPAVKRIIGRKLQRGLGLISRGFRAVSGRVCGRRYLSHSWQPAASGVPLRCTDERRAPSCGRRLWRWRRSSASASRSRSCAASNAATTDPATPISTGSSIGSRRCACCTRPCHQASRRLERLRRGRHQRPRYGQRQRSHAGTVEPLTNNGAALARAPLFLRANT